MRDESVDARQKVESGYCSICGCNSTFRFDPTIITPQLQKAWGISDNVVEAFNRKESMFCDYCGSSLRIRRLAAVLIADALYGRRGKVLQVSYRVGQGMRNSGA